jgi:hypothetical protein
LTSFTDGAYPSLTALNQWDVFAPDIVAELPALVERRFAYRCYAGPLTDVTDAWQDTRFDAPIILTP